MVGSEGRSTKNERQRGGDRQTQVDRQTDRERQRGKCGEGGRLRAGEAKTETQGHSDTEAQRMTARRTLTNTWVGRRRLFHSGPCCSREEVTALPLAGPRVSCSPSSPTSPCTGEAPPAVRETRPVCVGE